MGNDNSKTAPHGTEKQIKFKKYHDELEKEDADFLGDNSKDCCNGNSDQVDYGNGIASDLNPQGLRDRYLRHRTNSMVDPLDSTALSINPKQFQYPFENIVLEGGGNKGLAYVGVVKCFEELQMMDQIKRIGGASAGAITAALVALGYKSEEIRTFLSADIEDVFMDHSCGYLSLIPNLIKNFGWNPGNKIYQWFGDAIEKKTGNPDTTFYELYKSRGVELCVVVTNLNLMTAQYCHPKTSPDMPLRDALRMTMAIPGVFSAMEYENHGQTDIFVDGGVLVNYPINCFDGWFLSMDNDDSFLLKLKPLKELPSLMCSSNRFKARGPNKTVGFLLFSDSEKEIMRFSLEKRIGTLLPERPKTDTKLYEDNEEKKKVKQKAEIEHARVVKAVEEFLEVLQKHNIGNQEFITKMELKAAMEDNNFSMQNRELLFGKGCSLDKAFEILDRDGNDRIAYFELIQFIEERGIRMQLRFQGYGRREVKSFPAFLSALQGTLLTNMKYVSVTEEDEERTVGINTGHVGTMDYDLEESDRDFVVDRGYNATLSFLRYFAAKNPTLVKEREPEVHAKQPVSIHKGDGVFASHNGVSDQDALLHNGKDS